MDFKLIFSIIIAKTILFFSRLFKVGGGSAAPGLYGLKIEPELVSKLVLQVGQNVIITGTNGKTTTSRFLNHLVKANALTTLRNSTGSNLERGIASTLVGKASLSGKISQVDLGIWELDEAAFNKVVFQIKPKIIVFLNVFRDQLDRYGEVDTVVDKWKETLQKIDWECKIMVNGSDENILSLASVKGVDSAIFKVKGDYRFGEGKLKVEHRLIKGEFSAEIDKTNGLSGTEFTVYYPGAKQKILLPIGGIYHVYDFLAAFSVYFYLNLPLDRVNKNLKDFSPAFGRVEKIRLGTCEAYIFLIKNPAGATHVFETIEPEITGGDKLLIALNDNFADGTDVSWIWDAEFEQLLPSLRGAQATRQSRVICSGTRAYDLAVRLKYAGADTGSLEVIPDLREALKRARTDLKGRLFILPTYTALLQLQKIMAKQGHKKHYWKEEN